VAGGDARGVHEAMGGRGSMWRVLPNEFGGEGGQPGAGGILAGAGAVWRVVVGGG